MLGGTVFYFIFETALHVVLFLMGKESDSHALFLWYNHTFVMMMCFLYRFEMIK